LEVVNCGETAVFVGYAAGALFKSFAVLGGPPVAQISLRIKLAALIVEAVRKLVTDHQADCTEIGGVVGILIKERWLQDSGREYDLIPRRRIVSIHRRRSHPPLVAIEWLADFVDITPCLEFVRPKKI